MTDDDTTADVPTGATQLTDVLRMAEQAGFHAQFDVAEGDSDNDALRCSSCKAESSASSFERRWTRRLEGVSDPADMLHVSALSCPNCGADGVFVSPFGPAASERQTAVLAALSEADLETPPTSP